jgi:hypothetical protein
VLSSKYTRKERDMDNERKIWDEVEKTMSSLDNHKKLRANPFFYTRIDAKLSSLNEPAGVFEKILGLHWIKPALIGSIVGVNMLVLLLIGLAPAVDAKSPDQQLEEYIAENALDIEDDIFDVYNDNQ